MKKDGSLKIKLFTGVLLFVMLWIVILLATYYYMTAKQRNQENSQLFLDKMESMSQQVETIIEDMDAVSSQVLASKALQEMFVKAAASEYENINYFEYHIDARNRAQDILWSLNSPQKRVDSINVFYKSSYVGLRYSPSADKIKKISQEKSWDIPQDTKYLLLGPHEDDWDKSQVKEVISLVRDYIATSYGFQVVGTIEVQQDCKELKKVFEPQKDELFYVLVTQEDGNVIYKDERLSIDDEEVLTIKGKEQESIGLTETTIGGIPCMLMNAVIPVTTWNISIIQPRRVFIEPIRKILIILIMIGFISAAIISFGLIILINRVTKPILTFSEDIKEISELKQAPVLHDTNVKEVKILQESFQKLILTLKQSQDELILSQETELNLKILGLQSQINPHFLFNSLNAISSTAIEEKSNKVPLMCAQLGELFRYSSGNEPEVTLKDELTYMKTYLEFMKWRYEDNFHYEVVEEGNEDQIKLAKMTLQPLIENCFTHAFKQIAPPYKLKIKCFVNKQGWMFEVSDNGLGFSDLEIEKISREIEKIDHVILSKNGYGNLKTSNMAILNIYIRLKIQYKSNMYLQIVQDKELGGAAVTIKIDYLRNEETRHV